MIHEIDDEYKYIYGDGEKAKQDAIDESKDVRKVELEDLECKTSVQKTSIAVGRLVEYPDDCRRDDPGHFLNRRKFVRELGARLIKEGKRLVENVRFL